MSDESSLTIEEKRQALFAALLSHEKAALPLRERALKRVILGGMIGSSAETPFRIGKIQSNLSFGSEAVQIRTEIIQQTLEQLIREKKVEQTLVLTRRAYYLTPSANDDLNQVIKTSADLFDSVMRRQLTGTEHVIDFESGSAICREFICECMARFGHHLAMTVMGRAKREELTQIQAVQEAFKAAVVGKSISREARDELESVCISFLKSREPDDDRLKFYVTQGFYVAQLLGLENSKFNPLADSAFNGSVFYLDTNLLMLGLLAPNEQSSAIDELARIARLINFELRVASGTLVEAHQAASKRLQGLDRVVSELSTQVLINTNDQVVNGFLEALEDSPSLTPADFFKNFATVESLTDVLSNKYGVTVDDRREQDVLEGRDLSEIAKIIQEEAEKTIGKPKPSPVLQHDLCLYCLVQDDRETKPKTWFMTVDHAMIAASTRLVTDGSYPFCYPLLSFLQSVSPFVSSPSEEHSLVNVFSTMLTSQMLPSENVFEMSELLVLADLKDDIQSTPPEQIVRAAASVKRNILHGKTLSASDAPNVLLEIRKNMVSSADMRQRQLQIDAERLAQESQAEKKLRLDAEQETQRRQEEIERLNREGSQKAEQLKQANLQLEKQQRDNARKEQQRRFIWMCLGLIVGWILSIAKENLVMTINQRWQFLVSWKTYEETLCSITAMLLMILPSQAFIRKTDLAENLKLAVICLFLTVAFILNNSIFRAETWSAISSYIQIAALIAVFIIVSRGKAVK